MSRSSPIAVASEWSTKIAENFSFIFERHAPHLESEVDMRASARIKAAPPRARPTPTDDAMANPLHPMHRELLRRVGGGDVSLETRPTAKWSRVGRMAGLFYMGLGAWAIMGGAIYAVMRLVRAM